MDRHIDFPDAVHLIDNDLYNDIISTFPDEDYKDALEKDHGRSGVKVLLAFSKYLEKIHSDSSSLGIGADLLDDFDTILKNGIQTVSVASYNAFQNQLSAIRKVLPDDCKIPDPLFAQKLVTATRNLGTDIATRLDNALDNAKARGNLAKTKEEINRILSIVETDESRPASKALEARGHRPADVKPDAVKNQKGGRKGHPDRPFDSAKDKPDWRRKDGIEV